MKADMLLDPQLRSRFVAIFTAALSLFDKLEPIRQNPAEVNSGLLSATHEERQTIEEGLKDIGESIELTPASIRKELESLARIFRQARKTCVTIPDVLNFLAGSDLSTIGWAGWRAVVAAKPENQNLYPWAHAKGIEMKDFFISYNTNDRRWAEWIAWTLEEAGYEAVIQAWDFRAGGDFVTEMHKAATDTKQTIAVLSENYLRAEYTQPEWGNAFARDPRGNNRTLVPVRIAECKPDGLLATRIYVDLVGLSADEARERLLDSLKERGKPATSPAFPGSADKASTIPPTENRAKAFPGHSSSAIEVWQEKLECLRTQEPLAVDVGQRFAIKKQIEEAQHKIAELTANA